MTDVVVTSRLPLLIILSGPSGVGKDSVIKELKQRQVDIHFAVTATTRSPRPGEVAGKDYLFLTQHQYDAMLDDGRLIAPAEVHGNWYGAPLAPISAALQRGEDVFLKIDVQGAIAVRRRIPQAVFVFLAPPSEKDLVDRLIARHTESPEELDRRLSDARFELAQMPHYDYAVVNADDNLEAAVHGVQCIISAERLRTHRQPIVLAMH